MTSTVELVVDCRNALGEGVLWHPGLGRVLWTDIDGARLWSFDPATGGTESWPVPDRVASFAIRAGGGLLLALASGLSLYDLASRALTPVAEVEADLPTTRLNDGRCDRSGRFVFGGFDEANRQPISAVYQIDERRRIRRLIEGVAVANSICFSPDGRTLYFADTPTRAIRAYDYDSDAAAVRNERIFAALDDQPGRPDGSIVDAEGCLWNAQVRGGRIVRYRPDGSVDRIVELPAPNPTCLAFGGEGLDTLYITTLRRGMSAEDLAAWPTSGGLFALRPGVRGLPEPAFAG
jgi:L-arabinonolactonase